jgi:3-hydroxy-9,10-secoandrosta-1,3,5(10)-triene-9,17-dione monooxygenase
VSRANIGPGPNGEPVRKWLLIPRSDFDIVDDWYTVGLKGTGSKTIVVDDVFIPEERAVSSEDMAAGSSPGARFHPNPQYGASSVCIFTPPLAGTAIGAARGFLQAFESRLRGRLSTADPQQSGELAGTLIRWAKACADVDAARVVLLENARRLSRTPASQLDELGRARCRRDQAYAATISRQAVNSLFESSGASALFEGSDLQRLWRDTNAAAAHHGLMWDVHGLSWGRLSFGLPSNPGGI